MGGKKTKGLYIGCIAFAAAGIIAVSAMGISIVKTMSEDTASEVQAAEDRTNGYMIELQEAADKIAEEKAQQAEADMQQKLDEASEKQKAALEDHIREADDRFNELSEKLASERDEDAVPDKGTAAPISGEPGFNEP